MIEPGLRSGSLDSFSKKKKRRGEQDLYGMLLYIVINWNLLFHDTMCTYYVGYDGLYFTILLHLKN